ncbi:hypothetical protein D9M70_522790 [compost metagenome]
MKYALNFAAGVLLLVLAFVRTLWKCSLGGVLDILLKPRGISDSVTILGFEAGFCWFYTRRQRLAQGKKSKRLSVEKGRLVLTNQSGKRYVVDKIEKDHIDNNFAMLLSESFIK